MIWVILLLVLINIAIIKMWQSDIAVLEEELNWQDKMLIRLIDELGEIKDLGEGEDEHYGV
jgi:hypothetical protein